MKRLIDTAVRLASIGLIGVLLATAASAAVSGGSVKRDPSPVPNPTVVGPVPETVPPGTHSNPDYTWFTSNADLLAAYGYVQEEFFVSGVANTYATPTKETGWVASAGHPYTTRVLVRRPRSHTDFNGVVLLEWQNPSQGYDLEWMWGDSWKHIMRSGYAWVGVTAHRVNVHGSPLASPRGYGLRWWSPVRYGALDVTDGGTLNADELMHDIYSQAAQAVREPSGVDPMGGLRARLVLGIGGSGGSMVVYYNSVHPLHRVVDGFFFIRGGYGTRADVGTKVFHLVTEREVVKSGCSREPDSEYLHNWELAGAAHYGYDSYKYVVPMQARDGLNLSPTTCALPAFSRIPYHYAHDAAFDHMVRWVAHGIRPPAATPIEVTCPAGASGPAVITRDALGNAARGGVRLPQHAVPTAVNTGENTGSGAAAAACSLFGSYQPFDRGTLSALYPSHEAYVEDFRNAVEGDVKAGYVVKEDADEMMDIAIAARVP